MTLSVDTFCPADSVLWMSGVPIAAVDLQQPQLHAQVLEEGFRVSIRKRPAQPSEALASKAQHLRAFLVGMIGRELAERFCGAGDLGSAVVLLCSRDGWQHFFPYAAQPQDQVLQPCRGEFAVQVEA